MSNPMKVTVIETGRVILPAPGIYKDDTAKYPWAMATMFNSHDKLLDLPAYAFLVEHPNGKKILFDAGWSSTVRTHPWRDMGLAHLADEAILPPGTCIDERLAAMGIKPEDLDYVIPSHLHLDHAGGLRDVKGAKKFLVAEEERKAAGHGNLVDYRRRHWKGLKLETFSFSDSDLGPKKKAYDLFGDGSIQLILTPGHTDGSVSMLIRSDGKQLLLIGDSAYSEHAWKDDAVPGIMTDPENIHKTFAWFREFNETAEGLIGIISAHDGDLVSKYYEF